MPRICAVCAHPKRFEIDERLVTQRVNVSGIAREFGVARKSMENHRDRHRAQFIAELRELEATPAPSALDADVYRLYVIAVEQLATAEAGVWQRVYRTQADSGEATTRSLRPASLTSVARSIREARATLGQLIQLALDPETRASHATPDERALSKEIRDALREVIDRNNATSAAKTQRTSPDPDD
jgi:hypothetical protein